jgi:GNAT superfamily N-acetyltransferase
MDAMHSDALQLQAAPRIHRYPSALIDRLLLSDGRSVVMRPVLPQDAQAEQLFVRGLSPASRLLRFHIGIRELSPDTLRALTDIDQRRHVGIVAQRDDDADEPVIVADARYVMQDDSGEAEFALAVADEWQGAGLGRALMTRLLAHARKHGVTRLAGEVLHDNARMIQMVRRASGRVMAVPGNAAVTRARFDL